MILEQTPPCRDDEAVTVSPDASLLDVARLLAKERCEMVVVCDAGDKMVGVVTDTDVLRHVAACDQQQCSCASRVAEAMTRNPVTCRPDAGLHELWDVMKSSGHRRVPVVDAYGRLSGVANVRDVLRSLREEKELEKRELLHFLEAEAVRGEPVFDVLELLRREHFRIGAVLTCLQHLATAMGDGGRRAEPDLLHAILDYMEGYVTAIHHPKEETHLFEALRRRKPGEATGLARMTEEHDSAPLRVAAVRAALQAFLDDGANLEDFRRAVQSYIRLERAHMQREENDFMPLAARCLAAEDWRRICDALADRNDPAFGSAKTAEYDRLYQSILDRVPDAPVFRIADD